MGEITIDPIHNVHKKYRQMNLVNPYVFAVPVDLSINTYIGGVASTINTPALLATKLNINVSRIINFLIVGSDIKCSIVGSYVIIDSSFSATSLTSYYDYDGLVNSIGAFAFRYLTKVNFLYFPNCTSIGAYAAYGLTGPSTTIYLPRCVNMGPSSESNMVFGAALNPSKIYCPISLQTNNAGTPDGDIVDFIAIGGSVSYVPNFTAPNAITTLVSNTIYSTAIQLNFTVPNSTNAIDYYECYVDGVFKNKIIASGEYISGLIANTSYVLTVIVVDVFYNKSAISNSVVAITNNDSAVPLTGLVSYYKLDENSGAIVLDSYSGKNLTNTGTTINQLGKIGTCYLSTATGQKLASSSAMQINSNFSINVWVKRTGTDSPEHQGVVEYGDYSTNNGFAIWIRVNGDIGWRINQSYLHYNPLTTLPLNTWVMVTLTYDGANVKRYVNSVLKVTDIHAVNPNSTSNLKMFQGFLNAQFFGNIDEVSIYNVDLTQNNIDILYNNGNGITM